MIQLISRSRKESILYRFHEGLQYEKTFPKLHKNLVDNFQGKIVYDIPAYKNNKYFIDNDVVESFKEDKRSFKVNFKLHKFKSYLKSFYFLNLISFFRNFQLSLYQFFKL